MPVTELDYSKTWRGCLFCLTGQEKRIASMVEMHWPGAKARPVTAAKRRSRNGVKSLAIEVIMPSYVFFEVEDGFEPETPLPDGVIRLLKTVDGDWKLTGRDDEFAKWLLGHDGVINISQARQVGKRVVIFQGPLKDLEGYILRIDWRNENGLVQLDVGSNQIRVWLPFEVVNTERKQIEVEDEKGQRIHKD